MVVMYGRKVVGVCGGSSSGGTYKSTAVSLVYQSTWLSSCLVSTQWPVVEEDVRTLKQFD